MTTVAAATRPIASRSPGVTPSMLPKRAASKLRVKLFVPADQGDAQGEAGCSYDPDGRVRRYFALSRRGGDEEG